MSESEAKYAARARDDLGEARRQMAKKKIADAEDGLKNVAVAVGSALGRLAQKMGLGDATEPAAPRSAKKKLVKSKSLAPKSKAAPKKAIASKKAATKPASLKKVKSPTKKT
jgi:hypothetical protein